MGSLFDSFKYEPGGSVTTTPLKFTEENHEVNMV